MECFFHLGIHFKLVNILKKECGAQSALSPALTFEEVMPSL